MSATEESSKFGAKGRSSFFWWWCKFQSCRCKLNQWFHVCSFFQCYIITYVNQNTQQSSSNSSQNVRCVAMGEDEAPFRHLFQCGIPRCSSSCAVCEFFIRDSDGDRGLVEDCLTTDVFHIMWIGVQVQNCRSLSMFSLCWFFC